MNETRFILNNCSQVLTMTGGGLGVVECGVVRVRDGRIHEVADHPLTPVEGETEIDCQGKVVMPGFVDPHTHLVFGGWRQNEFEMRLAGRTYREIAEAGGGIISSVIQTRLATEDELYNRALERMHEMLLWGTTTVEVKSGYGLDTEAELRMLRVARRLGELEFCRVVPTFMGAHSVPKRTPKADYIERLELEMIPAVAAAGLARFCDVFCEDFVFDAAESFRILEAGKKHGLVPTIHADEIESSGGAEVAARVGAASASHLLQPSDSGLRAMAQAGVVAVLLPGTCFFLREVHKSPVAKMRQLGIVMALGSDFNPGSCPMLAQPLTAQFGCLHYGMTIEEALRGITVSAAKALGIDSEVGTLEPGKAADVVVTDVPDYRHIVYRLGHNPVWMTIYGGQVVHRQF
ncbi:imidazolonepropionase [candidate division WOR-3 bacterium]|uniref:Imidazolonepropionase n=1 Tax=candidate division WOR-3 bacterium TaxID=2052148 RepID=A0A938BPE0_UNCW3|nr:imidazolonepropionase [candidate division WOR-3 bacterium]